MYCGDDCGIPAVASCNYCYTKVCFSHAMIHLIAVRCRKCNKVKCMPQMNADTGSIFDEICHECRNTPSRIIERNISFEILDILPCISCGSASTLKCNKCKHMLCSDKCGNHNHFSWCWLCRKSKCFSGISLNQLKYKCYPDYYTACYDCFIRAKNTSEKTDLCVSYLRINNKK